MELAGIILSPVTSGASNGAALLCRPQGNVRHRAWARHQATSYKQQASGNKRQASSGKRVKLQAASGPGSRPMNRGQGYKPQATSCKLQAPASVFPHKVLGVFDRGPRLR